MKFLIFTLIISGILISCGGGGGDTPEPTPTNNAPETPTLTYPTNNLLQNHRQPTSRLSRNTHGASGTMKWHTGARYQHHQWWYTN